MAVRGTRKMQIFHDYHDTKTENGIIRSMHGKCVGWHNKTQHNIQSSKENEKGVKNLNAINFYKV